MQQLAAAIRKDLDLLVEQYDARLSTMPGYDRLPKALRRDLERHVLELIAQCLDAGDYQDLVQYVQQRAAQWETLSFPLAWFQQALIIPENILTPLIDSVTAANFLWQALNRSQSAVWQMVAEGARQTEQALQASQAQYQTIFDSTPIMFWLKDTQNRTLRVNKAAALFEGVQPADVEGKSCYDVYPAEQAEAFYQDDLQVIRSGQPKLGIIEQHTSVGTGKLMWVETGKVPVRDEHDEIVGVLAFAVDITARRETEATLAQERNLLRTLIDTLPDQVFVKDTQGRLILYNQADAHAMGLTSTEEALGKTVYDIYPREVADTYFADDMAVIESEQPLIGREEPGLNEDGSQRWILTSKVPLKDEAGRSQGLVGIARDITERKRIQATLQESEERFRRFSEATTEGLVFHDQGVILDANPAIVTLFGYTTAAELVGRNLLEFIVPDSRPVVLQKMQLNDVHPYEVQGIRRDGSTFAAETSTRTYSYGERTVRASAVRDITARKRLEEQIHESLARRSTQVQTSVEVAQHIAAAPEIGELFHRVVTLVKERFNYYHAQLFRYVPTEDAVVLVTGYGEVGQKMLAAGHKLAMGRGVVGTAAATGQSILAPDVSRDPDWRPNPNLPDTKGELAVPIRLGTSNAESQGHALKHFLNNDYDGIAVAAIDAETVAPLTAEFLQRGKPVVAITSDLGQDKQTALVSAVEHELGYLLGVQAGTWAKQHLPDDQVVKVGMLTYRTLLNVVERERGILDGIQSVIGDRAVVVANADAVEAKEAAFLTKGLLRDNPDLSMILAYNDATALGAYQAAQSMGWHDPDKFFIGGIDAVPEALNAIQQNSVYQATVNQPPEVMGILAMRTLVAAVKGLPVKPTTTLYCAPVNRSNVAEFSGPAREAAILANQDIIPAEALASLDLSGLRLGLSVMTLANPFFAALAESAQQEARRLGVQLIVNDPSQILGVLDVQSDRVNTLTDDDRLLLEGLCGQIASAMDSTRLLEQQRRSEAQLSEALKIAKLAYWEYDVEQDLFHFNDQFYALFHTTAEQVGGYQISSAQYAGTFVYPDDLPIVGMEIERALNSTDRHYNRQLEHRILYADGGIGYIAVNINIDHDENGKILRYYGANQDITERQLAEEAVRRSEAQLAEALKIAKLAYWEYDVERDLFLFNDQFYALFHTTVEQVGGYQISSAQYAGTFVHPDDLPMVGGEIERALNSTDRHYNRQLEHRIVYADGGIGYIAVNVNIDRDENGKILRYYGANQDITERQLAEEAVRRSEAQLSEALKAAKLAYWEYDVAADTFTFNDQFYALLRTTAEREGGYTMRSMDYAQRFVHPEDAPLVGQEVQRAIETTDPNFSRELDHRIFYADGQPGYVTVRFRIQKDAQGRTVKTLGANQDITERKQAEQALALEQSLMHALMDSVTDHIYFKDAQSRFLRISKSQADRFGLSDPAEAVGKSDFDFFTEEHARPAYEDEQKIIQTGQPVIKEERETWTEQPDSWVLTTKFPLRDETDQIVGTFGVSVDITERKLVEFERERLLVDQQRRALQLQTASEVARATSSMLELGTLLPQAAELIRERFNLYYVGLFLTDSDQRWAVLRSGTGEAGQQMLANGHKLKIGGNSMVSRCIEAQQAQIALDVGEEAVRFDNPLLPLTRSELALPLISRGDVIGAMTIQSEQPAAFTPDDITALQSMANQIGNAVENAILYEQTQAALQEVDAINRRLTGEAWDTYLHQQAGRDMFWLADDETAAPAALLQAEEALTAGEITVEPDPEDSSEATITAPILLRGQLIGALRLRTPLSEWDDDSEAMLSDIAGHIAQAAENARLVEQTQRTAQRERTINEINARVRQTVTIDSILETAVKELGKSLAATHIFARVSRPEPQEDGHDRTS